MRRWLPSGGELPAEEWERRHGALTRLLWASAAVVGLYTVATGYGLGHTALHLVAVIACALLGASVVLGRKGRTLAVAFGLLTAAALGVHVSGGLIEAHFSFFVVVLVLTLYEDWAIFLLAVAYVLLHHGILGMADPQQVFSNPDQFLHPWKWAAVHAVFVAAAGVAGVAPWRLNEEVRRRMRQTQEELRVAATTDSLTDLGNRRRLMADLELAMDGGEGMLALFDLDGFKAYNDTFGHPAGDALLTRMGHRLRDAIGDGGRAYRLGGDEFCVLSDGDAAPVVAIAVEALTERGEAFTIGSSYGHVSLGGEAHNAEEALRLADQRMYDQKNGGRRSASVQSKDVLLRAIAERNPQLGEHVDSVAGTAEAVARALGVSEEQIEPIRQAAQLHDVGKVAIPDEILAKPEPLDDADWVLMRRHTIIGERILAAAPALAQVARIVRSTHERWDGRGYPDELVADQTPLGSRIVAVCDAYDAMVSERPYQAARSSAEALAELQLCAGSQFDPEVVDAFVVVMRDFGHGPSLRVVAA